MRVRAEGEGRVRVRVEAMLKTRLRIRSTDGGLLLAAALARESAMARRSSILGPTYLKEKTPT